MQERREKTSIHTSFDRRRLRMFRYRLSRWPRDLQLPKDNFPLFSTIRRSRYPRPESPQSTCEHFEFTKRRRMVVEWSNHSLLNTC